MEINSAEKSDFFCKALGKLFFPFVVLTSLFREKVSTATFSSL